MQTVQTIQLGKYTDENLAKEPVSGGPYDGVEFRQKHNYNWHWGDRDEWARRRRRQKTRKKKLDIHEIHI